VLGDVEWDDQLSDLAVREREVYVGLKDGKERLGQPAELAIDSGKRDVHPYLGLYIHHVLHDQA
jgi:hypothetical protein